MNARGFVFGDFGSRSTFNPDEKEKHKIYRMDFSTRKQDNSFPLAIGQDCMPHVGSRALNYGRFCQVLQPPPPVPMGHPAGGTKPLAAFGEAYVLLLVL